MAEFPTQADLEDIQGDVVLGIPKKNERFAFFQIKSAADFKQRLKTLIPAITTSADIKAARSEIRQFKLAKANNPDAGLLKVVGINIAFTSTGTKKLGVTEPIGDAAFEAGQRARAKNLNDEVDANGRPKWDEPFLQEIDGVVVVAGESVESVEGGINTVHVALGNSFEVVHNVDGVVRPGSEKDNEHFGYKDGISQPVVTGFNDPALPGHTVVRPGVLICGQAGDSVSRPTWAKNGSFLCYRQLDQLVPEFDDFLDRNPVVLPGLPPAHGSALRGARFVGRWKSGAPTDRTPLFDNAAEATKDRNNVFDFSHPTDQTSCPFAAHIRKTNPRSDLHDGGIGHMIMRHGIPFGPEVTDEERTNKKTASRRGLAFVCYQSNLVSGFEFQQISWSNNPNFIFGKSVPPGVDPLIGQNSPRVMSGSDIFAQDHELTLPSFILAKGGAYFFSPSITALKTKFAA